MAGTVDPRFDPQFQRGYDPDVHGAQLPPPPPSRVEERREATRLETTPEHSPAAPLTEPDDEPARRIPYRLILLLASIASVAAAAVLLWQRITADPLDAYYGSNPGILFRQQFTDALLVPLLVAGLTGVVLWLAIGALRRSDDA
jgi:hypothetical protein